MHPQCEKCLDRDNPVCPGSKVKKDFGENCPYFSTNLLHPESDEVSKEKNSQNLKSTNPKDLIGSDKIPMHLFPETAVVYGAMAFLDGALKYGRSNWRSAGVRASIYVDAAKRHLSKWFEGETIDTDSGLPHLAHAIACIAILIDAIEAGKLKDDRMYQGGYIELLNKMTPEVKRLKEKYKDKNPKHWTIEDNDKKEVN